MLVVSIEKGVYSQRVDHFLVSLASGQREAYEMNGWNKNKERLGYGATWGHPFRVRLGLFGTKIGISPDLPSFTLLVEIGVSRNR